MNLKMDEDLKFVAEFMQMNIPADKLVELWRSPLLCQLCQSGGIGHDDIVAIRLLSDTICVRNHDDDQHTQLNAT